MVVHVRGSKWHHSGCADEGRGDYLRGRFWLNRRWLDLDTFNQVRIGPMRPAMTGSIAAIARAIKRPLMRCLEPFTAALVVADIAILLSICA
jgi:hypothetical protein